MLHAGNPHRDLIKVPFIASTGSRQLIWLAKAWPNCGPLPYGLMADDDAAGGEDLSEMAQAEQKAEIEPDSVVDDLGRKAVAGVAGRSRSDQRDRLCDLKHGGKPGSRTSHYGRDGSS